MSSGRVVVITNRRGTRWSFEDFSVCVTRPNVAGNVQHTCISTASSVLSPSTSPVAASAKVTWCSTGANDADTVVPTVRRLSWTVMCCDRVMC